MYPSQSKTVDNPWPRPGRNVGPGHTVPRWEMDNPTGPIEPVTARFAPLPEPVAETRRRRRRNPVLMLVVVFISLFLVLSSAGILAHKMITDNWGLPGVKEQLPLSALPTGVAPSGPPLSPVSPAPSATPQAPPQQTESTGPIDQAVPTHIIVRRGQTVLVNSDIAGVYDCPPPGGTIYPPGDLPYLLSCSSKVGDGMTIPAVLVGHTMNGNWNMPFTMLSEVQAGDLIDVSVPEGVITFQADTPEDPNKATMGFGPEPDTVKLVTCTPTGNQNVVISGHRVSSRKTA